MTIETVRMKTADGGCIKGEIHLHQAPAATVVVHGATGVPMGYYRKFAAWLGNHHQCHVLIYAYRDSDLKAPQKLRASRVSMSDWGVDDQTAALEYMLGNYPHLPLHTIGHSLGGMCLPFHEQANRVATHTAVNAGPAYWKDHPLWFMPQVIMFWFLLGPLATRLFGYFPGKLIGLKSDLPANVYWQWRRWCTNPSFYEVDWGKKINRPEPGRIAVPVHLVSTSDDHMIPPFKVQQLARYFPDALTSYTCIEPTYLGLKEVGHIGIFSSRNRDIWPILAKQVSNSIRKFPLTKGQNRSRFQPIRNM
ncbi:MAG: alpha/beta fold hydrolase [Rhizobiaceae bacterium]|nr:alpha/beta fold hydrolase [Rhizobiaceae bacterium]